MYSKKLKKVLILTSFFILFFSFKATAFASGEFYNNSNTSGTSYFGTFQFTAANNGTLDHAEFYMYHSSLGTTDYWQLMDNGSTVYDCVSPATTMGSAGASGTFPTTYSNLTQTGTFTGTQCAITSGTNYKIRLNSSFASSAYWGASTAPWGKVSSPTNTTSRIDTLEYSTSTRIATVTGYWNTHATSSERLSFWQDSVTLGQESYVSITATSTGSFMYSFEFAGLPTPYSGSTTTVPIIQPYTLNARLDIVDPTYYDPFGTGGLDTSKYITLIDSKSVKVSTLTYGLPDLSTGRGLYELPEYECSITSITGCLKNAGIWLFYPSPNSVEQFKSLGQNLQGRFPFAYAYGVNTLRQELFTGAETSTTSVAIRVHMIPGVATTTIELLSKEKISNVPYAPLVKTILTWILWLMAIEYIYYRVLRSHDQNTPS